MLPPAALDVAARRYGRRSSAPRSMIACGSQDVANPALTVRRLNEDVIAQVLAKPCP